jgi:hypothetical protein
MSVQTDSSVEIVNLVRSRGDTSPIEFKLFSDVRKTEVIDITGDTFVLSVSEEEAPVTATYVFQSTGTLATPFTGEVAFPITVGNADRIGELFYEVRRTSGGTVKTIIKGLMTFEQNITK